MKSNPPGRLSTTRGTPRAPKAQRIHNIILIGIAVASVGGLVGIGIFTGNDGFKPLAPPLPVTGPVRQVLPPEPAPEPEPEPVAIKEPPPPPKEEPPPEPVKPPPKEPAVRESYSVTEVDPSDALNLRGEPQSNSEVVLRIPHDAVGLIATGEISKAGRTVWREVDYKNHRGWVNERFLALEQESDERPVPPPPPPPKRPATTLTEDLRCRGGEPFWEIDITPDGRAGCGETCGNVPGLRAIVTSQVDERALGFRAVDVRQSDGTPFMSFQVRRTGTCTESTTDGIFMYEAEGRRSDGSSYRGCCNRLLRE